MGEETSQLLELLDGLEQAIDDTEWKPPAEQVASEPLAVLSDDNEPQPRPDLPLERRSYPDPPVEYGEVAAVRGTTADVLSGVNW